MEKVVFDVPNLWADHHVLAVRDALVNLEGVENVYASSSWKQVLVAYDPGKTAADKIEKALAQAGYQVGEGGTPILIQPTKTRKDPQWREADTRMTVTYQADLDMSGEFRRY